MVRIHSPRPFRAKSLVQYHAERSRQPKRVGSLRGSIIFLVPVDDGEARLGMNWLARIGLEYSNDRVHSVVLTE